MTLSSTKKPAKRITAKKVNRKRVVQQQQQPIYEDDDGAMMMALANSLMDSDDKEYSRQPVYEDDDDGATMMMSIARSFMGGSNITQYLPQPVSEYEEEAMTMAIARFARSGKQSNQSKHHHNRFTFHSNQGQARTCCICQDDFEDGESVVMLGCLCTKYHPKCIDNWLKQKKECPVSSGKRVANSIAEHSPDAKEAKETQEATTTEKRMITMRLLLQQRPPYRLNTSCRNFFTSPFPMEERLFKLFKLNQVVIDHIFSFNDNSIWKEAFSRVIHQLVVLHAAVKYSDVDPHVALDSGSCDYFSIRYQLGFLGSVECIVGYIRKPKRKSREGRITTKEFTFKYSPYKDLLRETHWFRKYVTPDMEECASIMYGDDLEEMDKYLDVSGEVDATNAGCWHNGIGLWRNGAGFHFPVAYNAAAYYQ